MFFLTPAFGNGAMSNKCFPKMVSVILSSSYDADVCSHDNFSNQFGFNYLFDVVFDVMMNSSNLDPYCTDFGSRGYHRCKMAAQIFSLHFFTASIFIFCQCPNLLHNTSHTMPPDFNHTVKHYASWIPPEMTLEGYLQGYILKHRSIDQLTATLQQRLQFRHNDVLNPQGQARP